MTTGRRWLFGSFLIVVLGHWAEHLVQVAQIHMLGWPTGDAFGLLGLAAPDLVRSEWLHWGYNLALFAGLLLLLPWFVGRARWWWQTALLAQLWHFGEHAFLLGQSLTGLHFLGAEAPTSLAQTIVPRVELHLLYNAVVTGLLLVGAVTHIREVRNPVERTHRSVRLAKGDQHA